MQENAGRGLRAVPGSCVRLPATQLSAAQAEQGALYRIVQQNLETFLAEPQLRGANGYPRFIERELRRFGDCGLLSQGFARLRCPECGHDKLVAFSCKSRALCPSCIGRRMADTAAQLRNRLMPRAPYRQWVLSFPYPLRLHLARDKTFFSAMLRGYVRTLFSWHRRRGRAAGLGDGQPAAVALLQLFGSAIQLTPHAHVLAPDGLWIPGPKHTMAFAELPPPTHDEVVALAHKVARRLTKVARHHLPDGDNECYDPEDEQAVRDHCLQTAIRAPVRPPPALALDQTPGQAPPQKLMCASVDSFSLHAATLRDRAGAYGKMDDSPIHTMQPPEPSVQLSTKRQTYPERQSRSSTQSR